MTLNIYSVADNFIDIFTNLQREDISQNEFNSLLMSLTEDGQIQLGAHCKNLEIEIKVMKEQEDNIYNKRISLQKRLDGFKEFLLKRMAERGITKIEAPQFKIYRKKNRAKVVIDDDADLSLDYVRIKIEPNKDKLRAELNAGVYIEGVHLEDNERIEIKGVGD